MLELDLLLQNILDTRYSALPASARPHFERLLEASDADLVAWLTGTCVPPDDDMKKLVALVRS